MKNNKQVLIELISQYDNDHNCKLTLNFINQHHYIFGKKNKVGHITASAFIINEDKSKILLTYHKKLKKWLQLGGHTEENETIIEAAIREAKEESGLESLRLLSQDIYDIDVHKIPKTNNEPGHKHYDIRFIFEACECELLKINHESSDLKWVLMRDLESYTTNQSIIRLREKLNSFQDI